MVDRAEGAIAFAVHKNDQRGKTRAVYLVPELVELLKRLAAGHPTGLLFRKSRGSAWTSHDAARRPHHAPDRLCIPRGTVHAIRHHRITAALGSGLTATVIAELVGSSPIAIARHSDHLSKQKPATTAAALKAIG